MGAAVRSRAEIKAMRKAGKVVAEIHDATRRAVKVRPLPFLRLSVGRVFTA